MAYFVVAILVVVSLSTKVMGEDVKYKDFRYSYEQMQEIANPQKLSHRIFYEEPSQGSDAQWFDAVKKGDLNKVKEMVEAGQNIEAKDQAALGQTALGWAAFIGYEDMVDYLIENGADLYATDRGDVYNVFKSAILGNNEKIVKKLYVLMKDNINLDAQEDDGETFLVVASSNNRIEIVRFLLDLGADPNIYSVQKDTSPLSLACELNYTEIKEMLIEKGAINHKTGVSSCSADNKK